MSHHQEEVSGQASRTVAHPRGSNNGWEYDDTTRTAVPLNAMRIDEGAAILNNSIVQPDGSSEPIPYTIDNPWRNRYDTTNRGEYPSVAAPNKNYNYAALKDKNWSTSIASAANELGVPGKWVADVMALMTEGSFVSIPGVSPLSLIKADVPVTGLRTPKGQTDILLWASGRHRSDIPKRGPEWLLASVMLEPSAMDTLMSDPTQAKTLGNGIRTLKEYWDMLGEHSGSMYDHVLNAERKAKWSNVHSDFRESCAVCHAIRHSGSRPFPHEYQEAKKIT